LTKIKIIGKPGQQDVEILKKWLEDSLRKFSLYPNRVYFIFIQNLQQFKQVLQRYEKPTPDLTPEEDSLLTELEFEKFHYTAYIREDHRKAKVPPIILIRKGAKISKYSLLDEVAHMAEDKHGWNKQKAKGFGLLKDRAVEFRERCKKLQMDTSPLPSFFSWFRDQLFDFFSGEMMCQHNLNEEVFRDKEMGLNDLIGEARIIFPLQTKFVDFGLTVGAAFWSTLPPSYPKKENESKLEEIVIGFIRQISMESYYRKIKSVVSQLKSPPEATNIYKCGAQIIELAQEFLEEK